MHRNNAVGCGTCADTCELRLCPNAICPHIDHRMELGLITYREAVLSVIPNTPRLMPRLEGLIQQYPGYLWLSTEHKNRMDCLNYELGYVHKRNTNRYYAAMYLLTSNLPLHTRTENCYSYKGIDCRSVNMKGISVRNYPLFQTARRLYSGETKIKYLDLTNPEMVDDELLTLIVNALLIVRFGLRALKLTKGDL